LQDDVKRRKHEIRQRVWSTLEEKGVARFPRPVYGRIPNFQGAEAAAERLAGLPEFRSARAVKVNPDAPQRAVREIVLSQGKTLLTPTPRMREGFILLDPASLPETALPRASTIAGAFAYGRRITLDKLPAIDLIVMGSVAVSPTGARLGKGEGYGELEYATLRELGLVGEDTPIFTTVHDLQIVDDIPSEEYDVPVDAIATPTNLVRTKTRHGKPRGIIWSRLEPRKLEEIPTLRELHEKLR